MTPLESLSPDLAKVFLERNGIVDAFVWDERPEGWAVFLGNSEEACGFREEVWPTKAKALERVRFLNDLITRLRGS